MIYRLKLLIAFLTTFASLAAASPSTLTYRQQVGFEENVGQFPKDVLFRARTGQMHVYVHPTDLRVALPVSRIEQASFDFVQVAFAGANDDSSAHRLKRLPGTTRYFRSADAPLADVSSYARVALRKLYDNIDLELYARNDQIEFDLIVHPGGDPSRVRFTTGQARTSIDENGDLLIVGSSGATLRVKTPIAYQELDGNRHVIASSYLIHADRSIGFRIEAYDPTHDLVIDPTLDYATYIEGSGGESVADVYADAVENRFIVGTTDSPDLPPTGVPTFGSRQGTYVDAFVSKYNAAGALDFVTIIGGDYNDRGLVVYADDAGFVYATGITDDNPNVTPRSWTFPTTPGAYRSPYPSAGATGWPLWVAKLHPAGNVAFSALLGGSHISTPRGIGTDRDGNVYVGGEGGSARPPQQPFPTTAGAYQRTARDFQDAFAFRLSADGSTLQGSTLFGGNGYEWLYGFDVDPAGNMWIGGSTNSTDLPTTPGAYQGTSLAARDQFSISDGFVARISADCRRLLYSSYIRATTAGAANGDDAVRGLAVDREGALYLAGSTDSSGFPLTQGAYGTTSGYGFMMKFDATNTLQFSARMPIEMIGIGVDAGAVVGIGSTYPAFPIPTVSPTQPNNAGYEDVVVMRLNSSGSTLEFSTYLGGSSSDTPTAIAMSPNGNATVVGTTGSTDFPVTANAAQPTARPVTAGGGTGVLLDPRSFLATYVFDRDQDGLLDNWETTGIDVDGDGTVDLNLAALGATPDHKDLFIEVDYMSVAGPQGHTHDPRLTPAGVTLPTSPIQQVITAFANAPVANPDGQTGIRLHVLIDENLTEQATVTFTGAASQFDAIKRGSPVNPCQSGHFGTTTDRANQNCAKILRTKRLAYRYAIFGHEHTSQGNGSSGIGELPGNDFMVTLRVRDQAGSDYERHATNWAAMFGTTFEAEWTDMVAGTFMHELGHTLRLTHGGAYIDRRVNCKPNILSVMNYTRQFNTTGIQAGTTATQTRVNRALDYSRSVLPTLHEIALMEPLGIAGPTGAFFGYGEGTNGAYKIEGAANPVDWNGQNGIDTNPVVADVNFVGYNRGCQASPNQTLTGFDDWKALVYSFRSSADYDDGASRTTPETEELTDEDVSAMVSGSRQPVVAITAPAANARFTSGVSIAIAATATDPDGTVAKVEFLGDGVVLGEDTTAPYAFTWQNVADGSHTMRARATDNQETLGSATIVVHVGCTTSVTPASSSVAFTGGAGTVQVSLGNACTWAAASNASWLTVTPAVGTGTATISFVADENTTTDVRIATVTVNETTFTVTQSAAPPFGAPSGLFATALKNPADQAYIHVAWNPVANADYYEVSIQRPSSTFTRIIYDRYLILPPTETFAGTAYLFKVRAISTSAQTSAYSAPDLATVVFFTDDPIVAGSTHAKALHITEMRPGVNAVRALAALSAAAFPTPVAQGGAITATPITELRAALDPARSALGLTAISYTDPTIGAGTRIKRAHVQEIRDGIK